MPRLSVLMSSLSLLLADTKPHGLGQILGGSSVGGCKYRVSPVSPARLRSVRSAEEV